MNPYDNTIVSNTQPKKHSLFPILSIHVVLAFCLLPASHAHAESIRVASYAAPVQRYGHFALGRPHEYARLTATTDTGRRVDFDLSANEVFEDLAPRVVRLAAGEAPQLLAIVSSRESGSRLMLLRLNGERLEIDAQSAPVGLPNRWLNPVAVTDLDGDGRAEIAAVITPHIGGTLKVYARQGRELVEKAALEGFSNHVYRTTDLALSMAFTLGDRVRLLVPNAARTQLRVIGLEDGRLVESGRCTLAAPVTGALRAEAAGEVSVGLASGRVRLAPGDCPAPRDEGPVK